MALQHEPMQACRIAANGRGGSRAFPPSLWPFADVQRGERRPVPTYAKESASLSGRASASATSVNSMKHDEKGRLCQAMVIEGDEDEGVGCEQAGFEGTPYP